MLKHPDPESKNELTNSPFPEKMLGASEQFEDRESEPEVEDSEYDSDSDEVGRIAKLALGVDPEEVAKYDFRSAPVNGSQYLMTVMREARKEPKVVVADVSNIEKYVSKNTSVISAPHYDVQQDFHSGVSLDPLFLRSSEWQNLKIHEFSEIRSRIDHWRYLIGLGKIKISENNLPEKGNVVLWFKCCFGTRLADKIRSTTNGKKKESFKQTDFHNLLDGYFTDYASSRNACLENEAEILSSDIAIEDRPLESIDNDGCRPLLSLILSMPERLIEFLINCHFEWLKKHGLLHVRQGEWIYSLLACVQKPLEPSTVSDVRGICKCCISLRDKVSFAKSEYTTEEKLPEVTLSNNEVEYVNTLNLFIYVIANYFGQRDLILEL